MMPRSSRMLCSSSTTRTRASAMTARDPECEGAAAAGRRVHLDLAPVVLEDAVHQGQPETAAAGLRREERLENVGDVAPGDGVGGILEPHEQMSIDDGGRHTEVGGIRHGLHGIEAEVAHWLAGLLWIELP